MHVSYLHEEDLAIFNRDDFIAVCMTIKPITANYSELPLASNAMLARACERLIDITYLALSPHHHHYYTISGHVCLLLN